MELVHELKLPEYLESWVRKRFEIFLKKNVQEYLKLQFKQGIFCRKDSKLQTHLRKDTWINQ